MRPKTYSETSRKSALATRSGLGWQGPEGGVGYFVIPRCAIAHLGARGELGFTRVRLLRSKSATADLDANPKSRAITSGFRVRCFASPRNDQGVVTPAPARCARSKVPPADPGSRSG